MLVTQLHNGLVTKLSAYNLYLPIVLVIGKYGFII